ESAQGAPVAARFLERPLNDAADVANVLAGRELGYDAAPLTMDGDLRGNDVRTHRPGLRQVARFFDHGGGRFVAGGFDSQDSHLRLAGLTPCAASHRPSRSRSPRLRRA